MGSAIVDGSLFIAAVCNPEVAELRSRRVAALERPARVGASRRQVGEFGHKVWQDTEPWATGWWPRPAHLSDLPLLGVPDYAGVDSSQRS